MADWFPILISILLVLLVFVTIYFVRVVAGFKKEIGQLNKRIEKLDEQIDSQQKMLAALESQPAGKYEPILQALQALGGLKSRGLTPTLVAVGSTLFQSYLKKGRRKTLPAPKENP